MNITELLIPRVLVMVDYPQPLVEKPFKKGDILILHGSLYFNVKSTFSRHDTFIIPIDVNACPELFKKLDWLEYRNIKELPEFVKDLSDKGIYKVEYWKPWGGCHVPIFKDWYPHCPPLGHYLPATKEDYQQPATKEEYEQYQLTLKNIQ